jgi:type IV secretory pathway VirB10-like protein
MSEEITEGNGINPIGKWLIAGAAVLVVTATVYGVMNTNIINRVSSDDGASAASDNAINLDKLREEAQPKPTPFVPYTHAPVKLLEPQMQPLSTPTPQRSMDPMTQWRLQKRMKALEAPVMVAAFESDHQVKEIPSHAEMDGIKGETKLHLPASPYTVMEGSHISAVLISGINSDFPGPVTAQVEQPLYDSASGRYLLIPQGSRIIGTFQQPSGYQDRVQIQWHRLIFPDTSSLDLPQMPATDPQGYAGATGDVNAHYLPTFATAALMSLLTAGQSIAGIVTFRGGTVSPYGGGIYQTNPTEQVGSIASTNAASQMGAVGTQMLERGLNRPRTVIIHPGLLFDIFVTADLVLPGPYADRAGASTISALR